MRFTAEEGPAFILWLPYSNVGFREGVEYDEFDEIDLVGETLWNTDDKSTREMDTVYTRQHGYNTLVSTYFFQLWIN